MLVGAFVHLPYILFFVIFADANVGDASGGMHVEVEQVLPAGAWQQVREGGCLLGRAGHLVVEPNRPNMEENLADSNSVGRKLCDWLDGVLARHRETSVSPGRKSSGRKRTLGKFFSKSQSEDSFSTAMQVTLLHIDLEDFVQTPDTLRHVPLPWACLTFTYYPVDRGHKGKAAKPVYFCIDSHYCESPALVYVLLSPEVSAALRQEQETEHGLSSSHRGRARSEEEEEEAENEEVAPELNSAFQMLPVRTFHWIEPECICLDGRFVTRESGICSWAAEQRREFPSASAALLFKTISLFVDRHAIVTGRLQLENPVYRLYARTVTFYIKPLQSRAILTRRHYYDSDL